MNRTRFWQQASLIACINSCAAEPALAEDAQKQRYDAQPRLMKDERLSSAHPSLNTAQIPALVSLC